MRRWQTSNDFKFKHKSRERMNEHRAHFSSQSSAIHSKTSRVITFDELNVNKLQWRHEWMATNQFKRIQVELAFWFSFCFHIFFSFFFSGIGVCGNWSLKEFRVNKSKQYFEISISNNCCFFISTIYLMIELLYNDR